MELGGNMFRRFNIFTIVGAFSIFNLLFIYQNCSKMVGQNDLNFSESLPTDIVKLNSRAIAALRDNTSAALTTNSGSTQTKVGMIYMVWHCMANDPNRNKVIEHALVNGQWGNIPEFHWRNVPLLTGSITTYCLQDKNLVNKHFELLEAAQIDYLVVDFTNQFSLPGGSEGVAPQSMLDSFQNLIDVSVARGGKIKIVPWVSFQGNLHDYLIDRLNEKTQAQFIFKNKPLIIASWDTGRAQDAMGGRVSAVEGRGWTVRKMWGLTNGTLGSDVWSFMETCQSGFRESNGDVPCRQYVHPEIASVSAAYQETVMTKFDTSVPKFQGKTFLRQLEWAQQSRAPLILINTWNEWMAQRFCERNGAYTHECYENGQVSRPLGNHFPFEGRPIFVDMFTREYSRDFEPDQGSSEYYRLLVSSVAAIKGTQPTETPTQIPTPNPTPVPQTPVPVNGGWSGWSDQGSCSKVCGGGLKTQTRSCTSPAPSNGGSQCEGNPSQQVSCNSQACSPSPVNGGWSDWVNSGSCSKECDGGVQNQTRSCTSPAPSNGGSQCEGNPSQQVSCNSQACSVPPTVPAGYTEVQTVRSTVGNISGQTGSWWCENHFAANLGGKWDCIGSRCESMTRMSEAVQCGRVQFSQTQTVNASVGNVSGQTGTWWCENHFGKNLGGRWECLGGRCSLDAQLNQAIQCGRR